MENHACLLPDRTVISVKGLETLDFLQDLVTCDLDGMADGEARYGALLMPQGKILFDFFILRQGDDVLLDCAASQRDALIQRLTMYKLRREITVSPAEDQVISAFWPCETAEKPEDSRLSVFPDPRLKEMGYRAIGPKEALEGLVNSDASAYNEHRIASGIADTVTDIGSGESFPHEVNLDQLGGVSFKKGCYIGQEVVSRMQHRGTARTRLVPVTAEAALPAPGTAIEIGGKSIGEIKSVSGATGLAMIRIDRLSSGQADNQTATADGTPLTFRRPDWAEYELAS